MGRDADLVIWDPDASISRGAAHNCIIATNSLPMQGGSLLGIVEATFLRGRKIFDRGEFLLGYRMATCCCEAELERLSQTCRSCSRTAGRPRAGSQRRILCAERKSAEGFKADLHRREIHHTRQMDGRLGNAPPPHARI